MIPTQTFERYAHRTMSANAFLAIVQRRLHQGESLSVVRMGDGERQLLEECSQAMADERGGQVIGSFDQASRECLGVEGIAYKPLYDRLARAVYEAEYYCPSVSGLTNAAYNLYPWFELLAKEREPGKNIVDNFWCNLATNEQRIGIYKAAKRVIFVHRNPVTANTFARRAKQHLGVDSSHIPLSGWQDAQGVIDKALCLDWRLALVSAGPASKWIIPELAKQGGVVLDLGNAADHWLLSALDKK
jgi:hypothetical protein